MASRDLTDEASKASIAAVAALRRKKLHLPRRPVYDTPRLPRDLTNLDDEGLMALLSSFTRYEDHIAGLHAIAEIDEQEIEQQLEYHKAKHLVAGWTGDKNADRVAKSKADALIDEDIHELSKAHLQAKAKRKMYAVLMNSMANDGQTVSRELTRRTGGPAAARERRSSRFGG